MCAPESKAGGGEAVRRLGWSRGSNWKLGNFCIILQSSMRSGFICRFGPSTKCLVCGLALLALFLPSLSHAQVIEEDGFPVKGGGIGGEPFSLSCPSRLYAQAGESVAISCAATSVPEEGVRYEWEPLSGDGLRLLSDANERSPLFTAPVSGEGAEYAYRLTAMSVGVYETASVTVVVGGVSGGSVQDRGKSPGLPEGCDSFGAFEGFREGCVGEDKAPGAFEPFGGGFEEEEGPDLLFPEAPGLPDRPSGPVRGGGPSRQAPPYLECPVAVFLEELETGAIECYASDAAGEEYLEYSWEPVGSTTRDYLDNPRLLPEDAPNPSVVAPEAPVYETLESFRSGETTFRYRYRLTATSRATGLSSREEVEVYVSSSRPSVYCPLEVVVEEGETIVLDCEGVDPLSHRMDYDEEGASILWEWEGLWGTSTAPLAATHLSSPLFTAPLGSAGKQYHYIASMTSSASGVPRMARRRVSVTVNEGEGAGVEVLDEVAADGSSSMSGTSLPDVEWPRITCNGEYDEDLPQEFSFHVHAGTGSLTLDCEAYGGQNEYDATYTYRWTAAGGDTPDTALLSATNIRNPVFDVPDEVSGTVTRRYDLKAEIDYQPHVTRAITASVEVNVMPPSSIICTAPDPVYEGSGALTLICSVTDEPTGATYAWAARGSTSGTSLLSSTTILKPTFDVPDDIDEPSGADKDYDYTVTMSATDISDITDDVTVTVLEKPDIVVTCLDNSYSVDEGDGLALVCEASGAPGVNPQYTWSWSPTNDVTGQAIPLAPSRAPTFAAPDDVDRDTTYAYRVTATAANADDGTAEVTVTVRDTDSADPSLTCTDSEVYEGTADFTLNCSVTNEPSGATYAWAARGGTSDTSLLTSGTDTPTPTFSVLNNLDVDTDYEYTVTMSATGITDATQDVKVTVLEKPDIHCVLPGRGPHFATAFTVNEGHPDILISFCGGGQWTGAPGVNPVYTFAWRARGSTPDTRRLSATNIESPIFDMPDAVDKNEEYGYTLTVSAENADEASVWWIVTVRNKPDITVTCEDSPYEVDEGDADIELECDASGAPSNNPDYTWSWSPTTNLTDHDTATPTFAVPGDVDQDTTWTYTVTATAENADDGTAEVTVTVRDTAPEPSISCVAPGPVYEKTADFMLDCSVTNEPSGATYAWAARGSTSGTSLLSSTTILKPTFDVPDDIDEPSGADKDYEYTVTMSATDISDITDDVTVTVLEKPDLICRNPGGDHVYARGYNVYEGDARIWISHDGCQWEGAPDGSSLTYRWTVFGSTPQSALSRLSSMDVHRVRFTVPGHVSKRFTYQYLLTASARNADDGTVVVNVHVDDWRTEALGLACTSPVQVYEGTPDFELSCSVSKVPVDSDPAYVWQGRGTTMDTNQLIAGVDGPAPTFAVPPDVDATTTYEYKVTVSAAGAKPATANVTVRVFDPSALSIACADPDPVYEATADITLDCSVENEPTGATYAWTGTDIADRLTDTGGLTPTFTPPDNVDADTDYDYTVTMMSGGSEVASADVTVTVLNTPPSIACTATPDRVYEGSADDITVSCSAQNTPSVPFIYAWSGTDDFVNLLKGWNGDWPIFGAPDNVNGDTEYVFTVNIYIGQNGCQPDLPSCALDSVAETDVTVTVLEKPDIAVTCPGNPYAVDEGDGLALDCSASGAPDVNSQYTWSWSPVDRLTDHDTGAPVFSAPADVDQDTTWTYRVTATADNADDGTAEVTVTVRDTDSTAPVIACTDSDVYEATADFTLDCLVTDEPSGATYAWTGTDIANRLSSSTILKPTFDVPDNVDADTDYDYTVTLSASGINDVTEDVTVRVLNKPSLALICTPLAPVYEGAADFDLDCVASGAPSGSEYNYVWTGRGSTVVPGQLSSATVEKPTFDVPDNVDADTDYEYTLTVSADNAKSATADVTVTVLNKKALDVACATPSPVYEGSEDFALDCVASGAPAGSEYTYVWTARGATTNTDLLVSGTDGPTPTFAVPEEVDDDKTYEYLLTASAENAIDATAEVTVKVLNLGSIALICASPPLVYEGSEDFALVCSVSGDTGGANYTYEWTARGATQNTDELSATNIASPTFDVPDNVDADTDYDYTVTLSASGINDVTEDVTVRVLNKPSLALICTPLAPVYEGAADFDLDCAASGDPSGSDNYTYVWTARGSTVVPGQLSSATVAKPTFDVPDNVDADTDYEYTLTVSADNAKSATADVTVTVLNKKALDVACATPSPVYESSADLALDCVASGAPAGSEYTYVWTARGTTTNTDLLVSGTDGPTPTFAVPEEVDDDKTYEYLLTASAENAIDATAEVTVKVLNLGSIALICASPPLVYEGSEDFALVCSVSGDTGGANYTYEWTARGATQNTDELSATNIASPTFYVPDALDRATTYEYLLTARAANVEDATAAVTVTVLNRGTLAVACAPPPLVYEGSEDFALDCSASGAPAGSGYTYAWSARGSTVNTDLLISGTDGPAPTFAVPDALDATTTYEYLLTVSAENAESATAEVMVTVLNRGTLGVVCADPVSVYEGSADIAFDCSASGAPAGSNYTYAWTARGNTLDTSLLSAADIASPTFYVPDEVDETTAHEYTLTASADNAEDASADVTVNGLEQRRLECCVRGPRSGLRGLGRLRSGLRGFGGAGRQPRLHVCLDRRCVRDGSAGRRRRSVADLPCAGRHIANDDVCVYADRERSEYRVCNGGRYGDGLESGSACGCVRGPGLGV